MSGRCDCGTQMRSDGRRGRRVPRDHWARMLRSAQCRPLRSAQVGVNWDVAVAPIAVVPTQRSQQGGAQQVGDCRRAPELPPRHRLQDATPALPREPPDAGRILGHVTACGSGSRGGPSRRLKAREITVAVDPDAGFCVFGMYAQPFRLRMALREPWRAQRWKFARVTSLSRRR